MTVTRLNVEPRHDEDDWRSRAACVGMPYDWFFTPDQEGRRRRTAKSEATLRGKKVCVRCDVAEECLEYAIAEGIREGIFGGKTSKQRRRIVALRAKEARDA